MRFLPYEDFEIHTSLTSEEVFYKLRSVIDTEGKWWINNPFRGEVDGHFFKIRRVTWWNHNFTPVIYGEIDPENSGCRIHLSMRMPWFGFLFNLFIFGFLWYMYFGAIANLILQKIQTGVWQIESPLGLLPGIFMLAYVYLLSVGSYKWEVKRVRRALLNLFHSDENRITYQEFRLLESCIIRTFFLVTLFASLGWIVFNLIR